MKRFETAVAGTDEHLIDQASAGDFAAFQELTARFQSRVFRVAIRIVGQQQDAEDVTQQTFLSLIEHVDSFRGESSVATWILRIATNHALKVLRKRRGLPTVAWEESADEDSHRGRQVMELFRNVVREHGAGVIVDDS